MFRLTVALLPPNRVQVQLLSGEKAPNSFSTLLDKDWMALGLRLNLPDLQELQLARVCMADAAFLSRHMCIDWSLLLGIVIKQTEAPQKWQRVFSGSNGEVYFIGVCIALIFLLPLAVP